MEDDKLAPGDIEIVGMTRRSIHVYIEQNKSCLALQIFISRQRFFVYDDYADVCDVEFAKLLLWNEL